MIEIKEMSFAFPNQEILKNVNLKIEDGEFIGVLGPNGGGKSTFIKLILGLIKPQVGEIRVKEKKISYVSQTTSLNDSNFPATVKEIVMLGLANNKPSIFSYKKNAQKADKIMKKLNIYEIRNKIISELSGGQLQRVKIAKALVSDPSLIVLDEPDIGMDEISHHEFVELINELHKQGVSIIFVSHHPHDLQEADRILFIEDGQVLLYEQELKRGHLHVDL